MKFTSFVFHNRKTPAELKEIAKKLRQAADNIDLSIAWAQATAAGAKTRWGEVHQELLAYAQEAENMAAQIAGRAATTAFQPNGNVAIIDVPNPPVVATYHRMHMGAALCSPNVKPFEWPKNHYRAVPGTQPVSCSACIVEMKKRAMQ